MFELIFEALKNIDGTSIKKGDLVKMVQDTTLNPFFKDAGKVAKEALNYSGDASKIAHAFKQLSIKKKQLIQVLQLSPLQSSNNFCVTVFVGVNLQ